MCLDAAEKNSTADISCREDVGKALANVAEQVGTSVVKQAGHWVSDENPNELCRILLNLFNEP